MSYSLRLGGLVVYHTREVTGSSPVSPIPALQTIAGSCFALHIAGLLTGCNPSQVISCTVCVAFLARWCQSDLTIAEGVDCPRIEWEGQLDKRILDYMIETGLDVLNPLPPMGIDPFNTKERYGKRLALDGGLCVQRSCRMVQWQMSEMPSGN